MTTLHERPTDTEQTRSPTPRSDRERRARFRLALVLAPLFLAASGLFAWWAADSLTDHQWVLDICSGVSLVLFLVVSVRAWRLWREMRR